ncbi:hypothetical protein [Nocardia neocaledoniensis]|uniref:hypothetical protein n=1 Tax=Nocardia neocaledoniensis TaxID=236511 RepID=UPI002455F59C|nr:hypothetical protein [Nocardia neocaledoniensis]
MNLQPLHDVVGFLSDHVDQLLVKSRKADARPAAYFRDDTPRDHFHSLLSGTTDEFLNSYRELAQGLVNAMNGASKEGLLVGLRVRGAGVHDAVAGLLKLEIVTPNGAALLSDPDGSDVRLEGVQDLLDRPGQLQKSAIVTSTLASGRVFCGDQSYIQAKYFPSSLGIQVHARPRAAMAAMYAAVHAVAPELTSRVADAITAGSAGTVPDVLTDVARKVPELTVAHRAEIAERLSELSEPVLEVDPGLTNKATYTVGDITVSGPVAVIENLVDVHESADGLWRLTIEGDAMPSLRYH